MAHANHDEQSPAERDLRTAALNSSSTIKLLQNIKASLEQAHPRPNAFGFPSDSEFLGALFNTAARRGTDPRLFQNAVSIFGGDGEASGGYAVPPQHEGVLTAVAGPDALLGRFSPVLVRSPLVTAAVDANPDWATQLTVDQYGPGEVIVASKPALTKVNAVVTKLAAMVHVSEELIEDAGAPLLTYLAGVLGRRLRYAAEQLLMRGTGMGEPVGALNAASLVVVAAEAAQGAEIIAENVSKMVARLAPGGFDRAFWVAHSSTLSEIMGLGTIYAGSQPGAPYGSILGRPVVITEAANVLAQQGDLTLIDPAGWMVAVAGPALASSIEFAFDQSLKSFKATMRFTSVPLLGAAVARRTGGDTLSHTITLAARS